MRKPSSWPGRSLLICAFWFVAWLAAIDIALSFGLGLLAARQPDSSLVRYFDYGRSIEGKLIRATALAPDSPRTLVLRAGWLDPREWAGQPTARRSGTDLLVSVYGQSFSGNVAGAMARLDGHVTLRGFGGPAAPLDHSYAAYRLDTPVRKPGGVVVVGILASAVPRIGSMSGLSSTFENPAPFTYPFYAIDGGRLTAEAPAITTAADFRSAFLGRTPAWQRMKEQLARHDRGFDRVAFDASPLDGSNFFKLLRRGWLAHSDGYRAGMYLGSRFDPASLPVQTMKAILQQWGRDARERGERLVVLLEQDQGFGDNLAFALKDTLDAAGIEYISSHTLFSSSDPHNFIPDGHYTAEANGKLAEALRALLRTQPSTKPLAAR